MKNLFIDGLSRKDTKKFKVVRNIVVKIKTKTLECDTHCNKN
jgi:hypothetical protein